MPVSTYRLRLNSAPRFPCELVGMCSPYGALLSARETLMRHVPKWRTYWYNHPGRRRKGLSTLTWEPSYMKGNVTMVRLAFAVLSSLILLAMSIGSVPDSALALPPVQGEVVSMTTGIPGTMVIRDEKGQLHILNLTQQTQLGGQFKVGDKVLAFFSPYGVSAVQLQTGNR